MSHIHYIVLYMYAVYMYTIHYIHVSRYRGRLGSALRRAARRRYVAKVKEHRDAEAAIKKACPPRGAPRRP